MWKRLPWWVWAVAIAALALATFGATVGFDFVSWDDPLYVTHNPLLLEPGSASVREHLLTPRLGYPIPVTVLSYRLDIALAGAPVSWVFHLTNIVLHAAASTLVFLVARRFGLRTLGACFAALVFAVHPVVAEPVCWVTGRKDLLSGCFVLAATLIVLSTAPRNKRQIVAIWCFMLLAIASKPVAAFAAILLPGWMWFAGRSRKDIALCFVPVLILVAVWIPLSWFGHEAIAGQDRVTDVSALRGVWYAAGHHLRLMLVMQPNSAKYLPEPWPPGFSPTVDLLPLAFAAYLWLVHRWVSPHRKNAIRNSALWIVLAYLPNSSILPLTRYLADTYLYLPLMGFAWSLGATVDEWAERTTEPTRRWLPLTTVVAVLVCLLALQLPSQSRWRDSTSLWTSAFELYPHDFRLCRNAGNAMFAAGKLPDALAMYQECANRFGPAAFDKNIGITLMGLGRESQAQPYLQRAKAAHPDDRSIDKYLR